MSRKAMGLTTETHMPPDTCQLIAHLMLSFVASRAKGKTSITILMGSKGLSYEKGMRGH